MPTSALRDFDNSMRLHDTEPIMERKSDIHGMIRVYPPAADVSEWADRSWLITTEKKKDEPGVSARIKAEFVAECYARPHFIESRHEFTDPT